MDMTRMTGSIALVSFLSLGPCCEDLSLYQEDHCGPQRQSRISREASPNPFSVRFAARQQSWTYYKTTIWLPGHIHTLIQLYIPQA